MMEEKVKENRVRLLRVLEYEGPRSWVEGCIKARSVKGEHILNRPETPVIREAIVGELLTILERKKPMEETPKWDAVELITRTEIILKEIKYELRLIVILLEQLRNK